MSASTSEADQAAPSGALTPAERSVRFINTEVLDPPKQGSISFVKPFADQVVVMALEDGRSFLQGVEQILLIFIAEVLKKLLASGAPAADVAAAPVPGPGESLQAAQTLLRELGSFHASLADTAVRVRKELS